MLYLNLVMKQLGINLAFNSGFSQLIFKFDLNSDRYLSKFYSKPHDTKLMAKFYVALNQRLNLAQLDDHCSTIIQDFTNLLFSNSLSRRDCFKHINRQPISRDQTQNLMILFHLAKITKKNHRQKNYLKKNHQQMQLKLITIKQLIKTSPHNLPSFN